MFELESDAEFAERQRAARERIEDSNDKERELEVRERQLQEVLQEKIILEQRLHELQLKSQVSAASSSPRQIENLTLPKEERDFLMANLQRQMSEQFKIFSETLRAELLQERSGVHATRRLLPVLVGSPAADASFAKTSVATTSPADVLQFAEQTGVTGTRASSGFSSFQTVSAAPVTRPDANLNVTLGAVLSGPSSQTLSPTSSGFASDGARFSQAVSASIGTTSTATATAGFGSIVFSDVPPTVTSASQQVIPLGSLESRHLCLGHKTPLRLECLSLSQCQLQVLVTSRGMPAMEPLLQHRKLSSRA